MLCRSGVEACNYKYLITQFPLIFHRKIPDLDPSQELAKSL